KGQYSHDRHLRTRSGTPKTKPAEIFRSRLVCGKLRGQDLNLRPRGYEPRELPGCSTPRHDLRRFVVHEPPRVLWILASFGGGSRGVGAPRPLPSLLRQFAKPVHSHLRRKIASSPWAAYISASQRTPLLLACRYLSSGLD